ncbi:MAG: SUMF1/EgtB/PvdO family nonheme iron enzyme [Bacteroidales bacterium]|nr:SUMF1/EgtB/PvdO family nonheme iron enzyme [Bacteroidales bacterium]
MKKFIMAAASGLMILSACNKGATGELIGAQNRPANYAETSPYGMVFIPQGSYNMGPNDQDVPFSMTSQSKTVTVDPFWMDETEITNNEYRQFVEWVRDSIAMRLCIIAGAGEGGKGGNVFVLPFDPDKVDPNQYDPNDPKACYLNWENRNKVWDRNQKDYQPISEAINGLYLIKEERFNKLQEIDARKLVYDYEWVDLKQAALKENRYNFNEDFTDGKYQGEVIDAQGNTVPIQDRRSFIMKGRIPVYPDTLCWMSDYTYSYNEPMARKYFWHVAFDNYPVVGVTWKQATAFCIWRTDLLNNFLRHNHQPMVEQYRLPTEAEWEYAARGGLALSMYPWGGPYTRNKSGCFLANFKPLRGRYADDGAARTIEVQTYAPNEYGLYDMAGNVAEWTSNAFDESAYSYTHDLNPDYSYNALADDPPVLKRKVVRGGSWKDVGYYLQVGTRTYEYQDTAKCYIGFRCVRSYMGRNSSDWDYGIE